MQLLHRPSRVSLDFPFAFYPLTFSLGLSTAAGVSKTPVPGATGATSSRGSAYSLNVGVEQFGPLVMGLAGILGGAAALF
jgi:hypothetical protein